MLLISQADVQRTVRICSRKRIKLRILLSCSSAIRFFFVSSVSSTETESTKVRAYVLNAVVLTTVKTGAVSSVGSRRRAITTQNVGVLSNTCSVERINATQYCRQFVRCIP